MESGVAANATMEAESLIRRMKKHLTYLQWDRDINGMLYYALWIVFIGGFVLSVNSTIRLLAPSDCTINLLYLFRILAIIGSFLNFILQSLAINAVRYSHERLMEYELHVSLANVLPADATIAHSRATALSHKLARLDRAIPVLHWALLTCVGLFLISGLVITWNIIPLASMK